MFTEDSNGFCLKGARVCDTCHSAPSSIFCQTELVYLCTSCDAHIHAIAATANNRHKRLLMCQACEQAPAAFLCKADAASLCTTCDALIHSANPLARRHHRLPVLPILYGDQPTDPSSVIGLGLRSQGEFMSQESEDEAASWLLFDTDNPNGGLLCNGEGGVDEYLDLVEYSSCHDSHFSDDHQCNDFQVDDTTHKSNNILHLHTVPQQSYYEGGDADGMVPVQSKKHHQLHHHQKFQLGMDYETSNAGYGSSASLSLSHSVSVSSLDVGVVPDSRITEVSFSNARTPKGTADLFSSPSLQMPTQLTPLDREARVLRYREKKKTRKFVKTIRYESRKAYAETRPRIKGRFAKRKNVGVDVEQMFSATLMTEGGYCIVPSFL